MPDAFSPWVNKMMVRLPGALTPVARDELELAVSEFFRESLGWQDVVGPYDVSPDMGRVDLNPVDGRSKVIHILRVYMNGEPVEWNSTGDAGVIRLRTWPTEEAPEALTAMVALTPKCPSKWMPPLATDHYFDAILDGALGRMYLHPLKPYTSDKLATFHLQRARARTREARDAARRAYTPDATPWEFPRFGV